MLLNLPDVVVVGVPAGESAAGEVVGPPAPEKVQVAALFIVMLVNHTQDDQKLA